MSRKYILLIMLPFFFSSCAWLHSLRHPPELDEEGEVAENEKKPEFVPRAQYDDLMKKYEELNKQLNEKNTRAQVQQGQELNAEDTSENLVNALKGQGLENKGPVIETVTPFDATVSDENKKVLAPAPQSGNSSSNANIEVEMTAYQSALELMTKGQLDMALRSFQNLERSKNRHIRTHAKFRIGEVFLVQKDYDLAMQAFEEIVTKQAYSSLVLDSLKHLVNCTEKLNLMDKRQKYQALLSDTFGVKGNP